MLSIPFIHFAILILVNPLLNPIWVGCGSSYCSDRWGHISPLQAGTPAEGVSSCWSVCACCPLGNHTDRDGRVAWWDSNNTGENIPSFHSCHGRLRQRNCNCQSKLQRWEKGSTQTVEKWDFCPFLQPHCCSRFLPTPWWSSVCFHVALHVMQFLTSSSFWPPNQFFPLSLGKKQKVWWGERSNFLLIACLSLSVLPSFQISRSRVGNVLSLLFSLVPMEKNDIFCLDRNQSLPQTPLKKLNLLN